MQNDVPMTMHRSKLKPQIECQYGGRPFSYTGSSFSRELRYRRNLACRYISTFL